MQGKAKRRSEVQRERGGLGHYFQLSTVSCNYIYGEIDLYIYLSPIIYASVYVSIYASIIYASSMHLGMYLSIYYLSSI